MRWLYVLLKKVCDRTLLLSRNDGEVKRTFNEAEGVVSEQLAQHTAWRVGGVASCYKPTCLADLVAFMKTYPEEEPLLWLGLGSNVLIRDGGVEGTVILTQGGLNQLEIEGDLIVHAQAGVSCAQLARFTARLGWAGLEFLAGIPGTVGGALAMNAGCHSQETWDQVLSVEMIDRQGGVHHRDRSEFSTGYRHVEKPYLEEAFVAGRFQLQHSTKEVALARIKALLEHREKTQPIDLPNCGSVFRNPPGDFAARLIEQCGLKGFTHGLAQVSEKHANFIVNQGGSAADIEYLIEHIANEVLRLTGVSLTREVHVYGKGLQK